MIAPPDILLIGAVAAVGVLHTLVPDHWVPITLLARQQGWTKREVARTALVAGTGHTVSTLLIGVVVWIAGVAFATKFGNLISTVSSIALIAFGGWIAIWSLRALRSGAGHGHSHGHGHSRAHGDEHARGNGGAVRVHGPELARIATDHDVLELSIFEAGVPPRFRLSGHSGDRVWLETVREGGARGRYTLVKRGAYWESLDEIPEPHAFEVTVSVAHGDRVHAYETSFVEHDHDHDGHAYESADALYVPSSGGTAVLAKHTHAHRHGGSPVHIHLHDHGAESWHRETPGAQSEAPLHEHRHKRSRQTTLLVILGSSPMVEGIPLFFAAGKSGSGLIAIMAVVFAMATIVTYVGLCVASVAGLQRVSFGPLERYGEVLSGAFIALVGFVFLIFPIL